MVRSLATPAMSCVRPAALSPGALQPQRHRRPCMRVLLPSSLEVVRKDERSWLKHKRLSGTAKNMLDVTVRQAHI